MADHERTVVVSPEFYADLISLLRPNERWNSPKNGNLVLWAFDFSTGENTALYFVAADGVMSGIIEGETK